MSIQGLPQVEIYPLNLMAFMILCLDYTIILHMSYLNNDTVVTFIAVMICFPVSSVVGGI